MDRTRLLDQIQQQLDKLQYLQHFVTHYLPDLPGVVDLDSDGELGFTLSSRKDLREWRRILGTQAIPTLIRDIRLDDGRWIWRYGITIAGARARRSNPEKYYSPLDDDEPGIHVGITVARAATCRKVQVGEKTEPVYEWVCDDEEAE